MNEVFRLTNSSLLITEDHLVKLPTASSFSEFLSQFSFPNFAGYTNLEVWITAATIAAVASIETLLCLEAGDKMDPLKRINTFEVSIINS